MECLLHIETNCAIIYYYFLGEYSMICGQISIENVKIFLKIVDKFLSGRVEKGLLQEITLIVLQARSYLTLVYTCSLYFAVDRQTLRCLFMPLVQKGLGAESF